MSTLTQKCPHQPKTSLLVLKINSRFTTQFECCDDCTEENAELVDKIISLKEIEN